MNFIGTWDIYEMEMWDEDYFNMEVQAYIKIVSNNKGNFQFGLVTGEIDGEVVSYANEKRFEFAWEGNDECDPAIGSGWVRIKGKGAPPLPPPERGIVCWFNRLRLNLNILQFS